LSRLDNVAAVIFGEMPRFDLTSWNIDPPVIGSPPLNSSAVRYRNKLANLTGLKVPTEEIMDTYWGIRTISLKKEEVTASYQSRRLDRQIHDSYNDVTNFLERKTLLIILSRKSTRSDPVTSIFYLFSSALFLNISMFLRDQTRGLPILLLLCKRIRHCLEKLDVHFLQFQYPELMLWILVMGGVGASKTGDRQWFAKHLADACNVSGLRGGDELAVALSDFLWLELYRTPTFSGFWMEVAKAQGVDREKWRTRKLNDGVGMCYFNNFSEETEDLVVRLSGDSVLDILSADVVEEVERGVEGEK
jgi:hypothetical protein